MNIAAPNTLVPDRGFNRRQKTALKKSPSIDRIKVREEDNTTLTYLEGWYVVAEANRIFGTENWDRMTLSTHCVWQGKTNGRPTCAYTVNIRIRIRVGTTCVIREGSGFGEASGHTQGEAHGQALKTAETDATKRTLATLGAPFGLLLYDKNSEAVKKAIAEAKKNRSDDKLRCDPAKGSSAKVIRDNTTTIETAAPWIAYGPAGEILGVFRDPILCCSAIRRAIEAATSCAALEYIYTQNKRTLARLHAERPDLRSDRDQHYASILSQLFQARLKRYAAASPSIQTNAQNNFAE